MRFGLFCVVVLFLGAELAQWAAGLEAALSPPLALLAGVGLAIASRYRQFGPTKSAAAEVTATPPASPPAKPPSITKPAAPDPISFKIRRPFEAE